MSRQVIFAAAALLVASLSTASAGSRAPNNPVAPPIAGIRDCPGGFALPGSRTCVRMGGAIRTGATLGVSHGVGLPSPGGLRARSVTRLGTSARVDLDVRMPTELGPLRAFTSVRTRSPGEDFR